MVEVKPILEQKILSLTTNHPHQSVIQAKDPASFGQRIDNFLRKMSKNIPKNCFYRWIRQGRIRVNGMRIKAHYKIQPQDEISFPLEIREKKKETLPGHALLKWSSSLKACVIYQNKDFMALNKPEGLAVHGGSGLTYGLIDLLRATFSSSGPYLELVHRLDRATSGLILVAKCPETLKKLHQAFKDHRVEKHYHALVFGQWNPKVTTISLPLERQEDIPLRKKVFVSHDEKAKSALSEVCILEQTKEATLLLVKPRSGRTHQIRVHLSFMGHPIVGDLIYGNLALNEALKDRLKQRIPLCLHSSALLFDDPKSCKRHEFHASRPNDFQTILAHFKKASSFV